MNTTTRHPHLEALEALTGLYGPTNRPGILVDHLDKVAAAGLVVHTGRLGDYVASPATTSVAVKVLCGHLAEWTDEDGLRDGRCGQPIVPGGNGCAAHHITEATCEHGMSLDLCAGPGHYPADR